MTRNSYNPKEPGTAGYLSALNSIRLSGGSIETVTILLADDEAMLLLDAGFLVRSSGKAVEILNSPNSAIGGVVTDIRFGELPHGWEDARIAREIEPEMPIVYISCGLAIKRGAEQHYYDRKAVYLGNW